MKRTIRLRINDRIYKHFMWFLQRFGKDEVEVINEDDRFLSVRDYLKKELSDLENGRKEMIGIEELDKELDQAIQNHDG